MARGDLAKKMIGGIYSAAAERLYNPIVVQGAFRLFGGNVNSLVLEQGRRAVAAAAGRPILDMPVGTAYFTVEMAKLHDGLIVGTDIAWGMVREARATGRSAGVDRLVSVQADAHRLPFADGSFGAILCTNGLQVIPGLQPTLSELARVVSPGGTLFLSVVNLPVSRSERVPTFLLSRSSLQAALAREGLRVESLQTERLATLIEAVKT